MHTTATHLHCLKDQITAAPCAAYLSSQFFETAQLRSYKNWITCHLHICTRTRGWGLVQQRKKPDGTRSTWAGSFQRKRWFLCCQRCTAFFLWVVLKDQTGKKKTLPPTIQNRLSLLKCFNQLLIQFSVSIYQNWTFQVQKYFSIVPRCPFQQCEMDSTYLPSTSLLKNAGHIRALHISKLYSHLKKAQKSFPHTTPKEQMHTHCIQSHKAMHLLCNKKILYR